jgi:hypothetical protein
MFVIVLLVLQVWRMMNLAQYPFHDLKQAPEDDDK